MNQLKKHLEKESLYSKIIFESVPQLTPLNKTINSFKCYER